MVLGRIVVLAFAAALWAHAAFAVEGSPLAGVWSGALQGAEVRVTFNADGSGELLGEPIRWASRGSQLIIRDGPDELVYFFELRGNVLVLAGGDLPASLALTRSGGGAAAAAPPVEKGDRAGKEAAGPRSASAAPAPAAGKGSPYEHGRWGVRFIIPPGWKAAEKQGMLLLGSDTEPGLMVVRFFRKTGMEEMRRGYQEGIVDSGIRLSPVVQAQPFQAGSNPGLAGEMAGMDTSGGRLKARTIGVMSPFGDAAVVQGFTTEEKYPGLKARVDSLAASFSFSQPKAAPASEFLAGQYWSYSSSGYASSGSHSTERNATLCRDGRFVRGQESSSYGSLKNYQGDTTASYGTAGQSGSRGRWSAEGDEFRGVLTLHYENGGVDQVEYVVSQDPKDRSGWGPAVSFGGTKYQRTGDGTCQ